MKWEDVDDGDVADVAASCLRRSGPVMLQTLLRRVSNKVGSLDRDRLVEVLESDGRFVTDSTGRYHLTSEAR